MSSLVSLLLLKVEPTRIIEVIKLRTWWIVSTELDWLG
jgi:hypothetical protein